jgi:hypothetical protein
MEGSFMSRFVVRLLVAALAFGLGLLAHSARSSFQRFRSSNPVIEQLTLPSDTFVGTGMVDMFMEDFFRESDKAYVRFGCSIRSSSAAALVLVRNGSTARLGERRDVLDVNGTKVGERVIEGDASSAATISWNEGSRLFYIEAPSVADAITFENSKVWAGRECWDFHSF